MKNIYFALVVCLAFWYAAETAHAAGLSIDLNTAPSSVRELTLEGNEVVSVSRGGTKVLYSLTFSLRAFGSDIYIPATVARRVGEEPVGVGGIEYTIQTGDRKHESLGVAFGALLSTSTLQGGFYTIPKDEERSFTLLALFDNTGNRSDAFRLVLDRVRFAPKNIDAGLQSDNISMRDHRTKLVRLSK